jgi:hypothetical protein
MIELIEEIRDISDQENQTLNRTPNQIQSLISSSTKRKSWTSIILIFSSTIDTINKTLNYDEPSLEPKSLTQSSNLTRTELLLT